MTYRLPTPLAHWVLIPDGGSEASLAAGSINDAFPYECAAGTFGDSYNPVAQSSPQCSGPCPAGSFCVKATVTPAP